MTFLMTKKFNRNGGVIPIPKKQPVEVSVACEGIGKKGYVWEKGVCIVEIIPLNIEIHADVIIITGMEVIHANKFLLQTLFLTKVDSAPGRDVGETTK